MNLCHKFVLCVEGENNMMTPEELAKFDQEMKEISKTMPALWWSIYKECFNEGFSSDQAMDLLKTFMMSLLGGKAK